MNALDLFEQPAWRHLVFALSHTLWQGAVLALLLVAALRRVSVRHPEARYLLALATQFGVLFTGLATWAVLESQPPRPLPVRHAPFAVVGDRSVLPQSPPAIKGEASAEFTPRHVGWVPVAALGWLAGVLIMLARTTGSALAAVRLTRGPRVQDRDLLDLVERLRREIGIRCHIQVVSCEAKLGPCVLGLVWPTIVLPLAFMTGLQADELRAILAHELEHIRRRDYLWNLVQLLVESLLFFNPVVWWLGRQVRIEREACCDAAAVALTGRPLDYSRALAGWAERSSTAAPHAVAVAWGGPRHLSPLRERILRILRPGERPRARISWGGLLVLLSVGPLALFGLHRGTRVAVKLAAQVLAPAERLERLKVAQADYAPLDLEPAGEGQGKVTIKGTIRTPDGSPLRKPINASIITRSRNFSNSAAVNPLKESFSFESNAAGSTYLSLEPEDYAPTFVGPFVTRRGQTVEGINVQLDVGFPARVRVVDERGAPVAGIRVKGGLIIEGGSLYSSEGWGTDDAGIATIPHASRRPYRVSIDGPGFQPFSADRVMFKPDVETKLTITHAEPTRGVVVTHDGEPIAGARIKTFFENGPTGSWGHAGIGPPIATTDSAGRFTLDRLEEEKTYAFVIESDAHGRSIVMGVESGQAGLRWSVDRDRTIAGTIRGDLAPLDRSGGKPVVRVRQTVIIPDLQRGQQSQDLFWSVPVEATDGGGSFLIKGLLPGEATLSAGKESRRLVVERPVDSVTIDLTQPIALISISKRRIVLRISTPDGAVQPSGSVQVLAASRAAGSPATGSRSLPIEEGKVEFDAPVPGSVHYESQGVVGYWFPSGSFEVEAGDEPKEVEVRGVPAGAIVGQVLDADGHPIDQRVSVGYVTAEMPGDLKGVHPARSQSVVAIQGRFFLSPLPIGGTYVVVASQGHNTQISRPVKLDGTNAVERIEIRLAKPVAASGRVIGPDGRPIRGLPVTLKLDHSQARTTWDPPTLTDREGRFQFDNLSSEFGPYRAALDLRKEYQPAEETLNPGGPPVEIRLAFGQVVEGRILDAATGWPIPGVEIYAHMPQWRAGERYAFEAEGKTDEQGRFRFSNLPARSVSLNDRDGLRWVSPGDSRTVETDRGETFEIRATLPAWSPLKPVEPRGK
ncbi:M56 family metallopeptidase [Singulisphaera sp. Ch08]|uniref:M56 family metallopeptidase n=1 Tax=Singulisphaera sp. Ch08 TaxID=3120278 RepID=A0AAU7CQQ3_9BACT